MEKGRNNMLLLEVKYCSYIICNKVMDFSDFQHSFFYM